jgi:putative FmdB family regulatory protein
MAYYEFKCTACGTVFTRQESFEEHERHKQVKCPECGSQRVERIWTPVHVVTGKKS